MEKEGRTCRALQKGLGSELLWFDYDCKIHIISTAETF